MSVGDANPYLLLAVNGFCTGMGVVFAQWFHEKYLRTTLDKVHDATKGLVKNGKKGKKESVLAQK